MHVRFVLYVVRSRPLCAAPGCLSAGRPVGEGGDSGRAPERGAVNFNSLHCLLSYAKDCLQARRTFLKIDKVPQQKADERERGAERRGGRRATRRNVKQRNNNVPPERRLGWLGISASQAN